jgi:hypothetical protein
MLNAFVSGVCFTMALVEVFRGNLWFAAGHLILSAINLFLAMEPSTDSAP